MHQDVSTVSSNPSNGPQMSQAGRAIHCHRISKEDALMGVVRPSVYYRPVDVRGMARSANKQLDLH